jgi:hypothetical protein
MNLKSKAIFNSNIIIWKIIHVAIDFNDNHIFKMVEFKENCRLIMNYWNDDIAFVTQTKWKMWIPKNVKVMSKLKQ